MKTLNFYVHCIVEMLDLVKPEMHFTLLILMLHLRLDSLILDRNINVFKGNLWHICAMEHLKEDPDAQFNFIQCMLDNMYRGTPKEVASKCSLADGVFGPTSFCATGSQGE